MNAKDILDAIKNQGEGMFTLDEIDAIKAAATTRGKALREVVKEMAKSAKAEAEEHGIAQKASVKVGSRVKYIFGSGKNQEVREGIVSSVKEKTFTLEKTPGQERATWRYFEKLVEVMEPVAPVAEAVVDPIAE